MYRQTKCNKTKWVGNQGREQDWLTATSLYSAARIGELNFPDHQTPPTRLLQGEAQNFLSDH